MEHFEHARKHLGPQAEFSEKLADLYANYGKNNRCQTILENISNRPDSGPVILRKLSQSQWASGKFEQALSTLNRAISRFPDDANLYIQAGLFASAQKNYEKSEKFFSKAIDNDCGNFKPHYYYGLTLLAR